jgi:hypothetical protein
MHGGSTDYFVPIHVLVSLPTLRDQQMVLSHFSHCYRSKMQNEKQAHKEKGKGVKCTGTLAHSAYM